MMCLVGFSERILRGIEVGPNTQTVDGGMLLQKGEDAYRSRLNSYG
ncbi:MAG TPA: hypothetical protein VKP30_17740 [Polyangiaceae bacterium]|nr:hypothetical protein [Polyangiaceae bacterium]